MHLLIRLPITLRGVMMLASCRYGFLLLLPLMVGTTAADDADADTENQNSLPIINETTSLKAVEGYIGDQLGAEVKEVIIDRKNGGRVIEVHIPVDPEKADEIQVITESGNVLKKDKIEQVIKDYENNNVGVKFYLPKQKNWVFKIRLIDNSDIDHKP